MKPLSHETQAALLGLPEDPRRTLLDACIAATKAGVSKADITVHGLQCPRTADVPVEDIPATIARIERLVRAEQREPGYAKARRHLNVLLYRADRMGIPKDVLKARVLMNHTAKELPKDMIAGAQVRAQQMITDGQEAVKKLHGHSAGVVVVNNTVDRMKIAEGEGLALEFNPTKFPGLFEQKESRMLRTDRPPAKSVTVHVGGITKNYPGEIMIEYLRPCVKIRKYEDDAGLWAGLGVAVAPPRAAKPHPLQRVTRVTPGLLGAAYMEWM